VLQFSTTPGMAAAAAVAVVLALLGALAVACFVKLGGALFLGSPRKAESGTAHDPAPSLLGPMAVLALGCVTLGLFPVLAAPVLEQAVRTWAGPLPAALALSQIVPWQAMTGLGLALLALAAGLALMVKRLPQTRAVPRTITWDCGYARPTARMQYTGSSFTQTLVRLFAFLLRPQTHQPGTRAVFPKASTAKTVVPDLLLERGVLPLLNLAARTLPRIRLLQQGQTYMYVLYILIITCVLLFFWGVGIPS
jgi:hydrogenase-4 component B